MVASLADPLLARLRHNVDVLLFNPPYVPTVSEEWESAQAGRSLEGAWAGGADGMQLTNELLMSVDVSLLHSFYTFLFDNLSRDKHLLSANGKFYLVALKANGIENIRRRMREEFQLGSEACVYSRLGCLYLQEPMSGLPGTSCGKGAFVCSEISEDDVKSSFTVVGRINNFCGLPHKSSYARSFGVQKYVHRCAVNSCIPYAFCNDSPSRYLCNLSTQ